MFAGLFVDPAFDDVLGWRCDRRVVGIDAYLKRGDIELRTDSESVREWEYCVVAELAPTADPDNLTSEADVAAERDALAARGVDCLSVEIMKRPQGAGTASPLASSLWPGFPGHFDAAIEYIDIPDEYWQTYKQFMHDIFGPVGRRLVQTGLSYRIAITEHHATLYRDPSLPKWNRMHVLTGDFSDSPDGFFAHLDDVVADVVGNGHTADSALAMASYRRKPRMSRNALLHSLRGNPGA